MRFYRALLYLYPSAFRTEYADELCRTFAERMRGRAATAAVIAAIVDVGPNAIAARWDMLRLGGSRGMALPTAGPEIAVRLSLGATRIRLIRQMLTKALVLAFAGAALGLLLYVATIKITYATVPELIYGLEPQPATFACAALFALATTIAFGLAPALHATRTDFGEAMKNSGTLAIKRSRLQGLFVVIQLACSQPVLVVTSLVLGDIASTVHTNADNAPASVMTMNVNLDVSSASLAGLTTKARQNAAAAVPATLSRMQQRIAAVPAVRFASVSAEGATVECYKSQCIARGESNTFGVPGGGAETRMKQSYVTSDYFTTLGIPITRGRATDRPEDRRGSLVAVVNEQAASVLWPHENPIGQRLVRRTGGTNGTTTLEVIGVAGMAPYDDADRQPEIYAPLSTALAAGATSGPGRSAGRVTG